MTRLQQQLADRLADIAAEESGLPKHQIMSGCRTSSLAYCRFAIAYTLRKACGFTWLECAEAMGALTHGSAMHAYRQAEAKMQQDITYRPMVEKMMAAAGGELSRLADVAKERRFKDKVVIEEAVRRLAPQPKFMSDLTLATSAAMRLKREGILAP